MTNEEALIALKERYADKSWIDILDQIQDTSVWQKAIEALEKQVPKRIMPDDRDVITCPRCGEESLFEMPGYGSYGYCANCGQAIDWGYDD